MRFVPATVQTLRNQVQRAGGALRKTSDQVAQIKAAIKDTNYLADPGILPVVPKPVGAPR